MFSAGGKVLIEHKSRVGEAGRGRSRCSPKSTGSAKQCRICNTGTGAGGSHKAGPARHALTLPGAPPLPLSHPPPRSPLQHNRPALPSLEPCCSPSLVNPPSFSNQAGCTKWCRVTCGSSPLLQWGGVGGAGLSLVMASGEPTRSKHSGRGRAAPHTLHPFPSATATTKHTCACIQRCCGSAAPLPRPPHTLHSSPQ